MPNFFRLSDGSVPLLDTEGKPLRLPEADAVKAIQDGTATADTTEDTRKRFKIRTLDPAEATDAPVLAATLGAASDFTLGGTDVLARVIGGEEAGGALKTLEESNPIASTIGQVGGTVASAVFGPLGAIGKVAQGAARGIAPASRIVQAVVPGLAEGAAIGGGQGVSDVAQTAGPIDAGEAAGHLLTSTAEGAAIGGAFSVVGLGVSSLARFTRGKVKAGLDKATKRSAQQAERAGLEAEAEALTAKGVRTDLKPSSLDPAGQIDAARLSKLEIRLADLAEEMATAPTSLAGTLLQAAQERVGSRAAGAVFGAVSGGLPGVLVGGLLAPAAISLTKKALAPVLKGAAAAAKGIAKSPSIEVAGGILGEAAKLSGRVAKRQTIKTITAEEFSNMAAELSGATPGRIESQLNMQMSEIPPLQRQEAVQREVRRITFMADKVQSVMPQRPLDVVPVKGAVGPVDPGTEARIDVTRSARAAMAPETVIEDFAAGDLTQQGIEAAEAVAPEELEIWRRLVQEEISVQVARGMEYTWQQEQQIALALGMPSATWSTTPASAGALGLQIAQAQQRGSDLKPEAPSGLDVQRMTKMQKLLEGPGA